MLKITPVMLLLVLPLPVLAQAPTPEAREAVLDAMRPLDFLVGDWRGEGWIARGPDERHRFVQTEHIRPLLGGEALLIEGRGFAAEDTSRVIHDAVAVIGYDAAAEDYVMRTFLAGGRGADATVQELADDTLVWQIGSTVRYTIRLNEAGQWHEIGEYSRDDGETWSPFLEMTLDRVE